MRRRAILSDDITEFGEQGDQLVIAAVYVADDIKGAELRAFVIPERLSLQGYGVDLLWRAQHEHMPKAFSLQLANRAPHLLALLTDDMRAKCPIGAPAVPFLADLLRQRKDDGYRQAMEFPREVYQRLPRFLLHVRCIHHRQTR